VNEPTVIGLKVIVTEQLAPGGRLLPQVWVWWNDVAPAPVMVMLEIFRVAVPGFCTAMVLEGLPMPTASVGNSRADDEKEISGVNAAIVNDTEFEVPPPGAGVTTIINAPPLFARSVDGTMAVRTVFAT